MQPQSKVVVLAEKHSKIAQALCACLIGQNTVWCSTGAYQLASLLSQAFAIVQVLVEGYSKKSDAQLSGRSDTMKRVVFDDVPVPAQLTATSADQLVSLKPGDYVAVHVHACTSGTLFAQPLAKTSLQAFYASPPAASAVDSATPPVEQRQAASLAC